jgi:hypothetical protein
MHAPNSNDGHSKKILQFGNSIKVSITQASGHITICVPPTKLQTYKWFNKQPQNFKMHAPNPNDGYPKKILLRVSQLGF